MSHKTYLQMPIGASWLCLRLVHDPQAAQTYVTMEGCNVIYIPAFADLSNIFLIQSLLYFQRSPVT